MSEIILIKSTIKNYENDKSFKKKNGKLYFKGDLVIAYTPKPELVAQLEHEYDWEKQFNKEQTGVGKGD